VGPKKKRDYAKIMAVVAIVGLVCSIGCNFFQAWQVDSLHKENQRLYLESLRADLNILIDTIEIQNWTFVPEGVFLEVKGELHNEGARTTEITKGQISLEFIFPKSGGQYTFIIPLNFTRDFSMEDYAVEKDGERSFKFTYYIMKHLVFNDRTGEVIQIGDEKPEKVAITIWHNDGKEGELTNYNEAPRL